ncbi:hypothetical protein HanIR_Chr06g0290301 [Helianthus annuus]|nr:hypothetical protein HanIR_Chr06g0290301 [Helianthus annuus]
METQKPFNFYRCTHLPHYITRSLITYQNTRRFQKKLQTKISHFTRKSDAVNDPTMATSWTDVEDIALCEAWEQAMIDPPPRGHGGL